MAARIKDLSLPLRQQILSLINDHGGVMKRHRVRDSLCVRLALLDPLLSELEKEGWIKIEVGKKGGMLSLLRKPPNNT